MAEKHETPINTIFINVRRQVNQNYLKLYHYFISHSRHLLLIPILFLLSSAASLPSLLTYVNLNPSTFVLMSSILATLATFYFKKRPRPVYLVDLSCYKPSPSYMITHETFMKQFQSSGTFTDDSISFQRRMLERSGLGQSTYLPKSLLTVPMSPSMGTARDEAATVMFGAIDELFKKTGVAAKEIGILVVNCSLFCQSPSLSAIIVNHYGLRGNVMSYSLGGMGCSAGIISIDLAKQLLQVRTSVIVGCFLISLYILLSWAYWASPH